MIDPFNGEDVWNKIVVAGIESPGVVRLSGHDRKIAWDIKEGTGQDGATTSRKGKPIGEFDAEFELSNDPTSPDSNDFDDWDSFQALLETSVSGKDPVALDIYHPDLARNHFSSVVLGSIGAMSLDGKGGGKIKVHFLEYNPPKKKAATGANGSKSKTEGDKKIDQAKDDLAKALAEGDKL